VPSPLQILVHSSLGVHSLIKRQPLKHNVIDRDKVVLPPNWDSWGKIRVLREGFDVEGVNQGWSIDIEEPSRSVVNGTTAENDGEGKHEESFREPRGALAHYEEAIRDPGADLLSSSSVKRNGQNLDVESMDPQSFLGSQLEVLERIKNAPESSTTDGKRDSSARKPSHSGVDIDEERNVIEEGRVNEHIGPVQFNVGGIQVDADDMLKRLKVVTSCLNSFYCKLTSHRTAKVIKHQAWKHLVW
jgi:dynein light intermediate chain 1, cytosolic